MSARVSRLTVLEFSNLQRSVHHGHASLSAIPEDYKVTFTHECARTVIRAAHPTYLP
ncbi:hypothetical protein J6590_099974 [Homalodisca vitripennis]|nr:hypothetical protein J6590_099974 [Homalodisca vitripennis]